MNLLERMEESNSINDGRLSLFKWHDLKISFLLVSGIVSRNSRQTNCLLIDKEQQTLNDGKDAVFVPYTCTQSIERNV